MICDENYDHSIKYWKCFVVDGERYKPDTWYKLDENGNVSECE